MVDKKVIKGKWVVKVPEEGRILVREDSNIEIGQVLINVEKIHTKSFDASMILSKMSKSRLEEWTGKWKGKEVEEGKVVYEGEGLFAKKIYSPVSGVFKNVDEFFNIVFELREGEKKEIVSPVKAKVAKVEKDEIVLEFKAKEYKGEAIIDGKAWGESGVKIEKLNDLNSGMKGKLILTEVATLTLIIKADVVGVSGIVTTDDVEDAEEIETKIPILKVDKDVFKILVEEFEKKPKSQVLLNSKMERLLVVE